MNNRALVTIEGEFFTVPVELDVQRTLMAWVRDHLDDLDTRLAPFDLTAADLAMPEWHRVVYTDEITEKP